MLIKNVEDQRKLERLINQDILMRNNEVVEKLLEVGELNYYNFENIADAEVFEWYFIKERLYEDLQEHQEVVANTKFGFIWGRCTTGQSISMDYTIQEIYKEFI